MSIYIGEKMRNNLNVCTTVHPYNVVVTYLSEKDVHDSEFLYGKKLQADVD